MTNRIFADTPPLPRGPHGLSRDEVAESQRARLMSAITALLAERGYSGVTIGELARRAGVSRAAFYEHFADKEACLLAAYDRFAAHLVGAMSAEVDDETPWSAFIERTVAGYLGALEGDRVAARAFLVEMDGAGPAARARRRDAIHGFAALIARRHTDIRARDRSLGPLPDRAYLGLAIGVRELVREAVEEKSAPPLSEMTSDILVWVTAMVEGARAAQDPPRR